MLHRTLVLLGLLAAACTAPTAGRTVELSVPAGGPVDAAFADGERTLPLELVAAPSTRLLRASLDADARGTVLTGRLQARWPVTGSERHLLLEVLGPDGEVQFSTEGEARLRPDTAVYHRTRELDLELVVPRLAGGQRLRLTVGR